MFIYKISFLKNKVLSITRADDNTHFDGNVFFEQANGQLIFAIVRAADEDAALEVAKNIIATALPAKS